ncbi:nuclease [Pseudoalteromonas rubra]|uniref:Nuclease n=1 Tax=Pseudoalteromonas rubra TaxID=43658 RepID=A0A5S3WRX4_9GAMM|nr:nuclease [Pseudoalteromonas rubra]TMP31587.1 nuclease [Pseudoalteromonas rubra]TMP34670.1 nuclease [Pseudoalteromonas rubra]
MPVKTNLWRVSEKPEELAESRLDTEKLLEKMIVQEPRLLSDEWMLIGQQEHTYNKQPLDLLAIAPDASLVLIELKRDRTPRDVVAQALDYASWVENLTPDKIAAIYRKFTSGGNLAEGFQKKFSRPLDEDELNQSHQIIIVAAELDASTERIVKYLNDRSLAINVLFFQVFAHGDEKIISRTWLLDPIETQSASSPTKSSNSEPWNGEFYCSFGDSNSRSWNEARHYGFICGGGGAWYSRTLQLLSPGNRVWVKVPGMGFVGVGQVLSQAVPASEFTINTSDGEKPAMEVLTEGNYHRDFIDDEEKCEYFVAIEWLETKDLSEAIQELGMFGNQNTICKPTTAAWRTTVNRLKSIFTNFEK